MQHPWLSSLNNRFLELDDGLDDEQLEQVPSPYAKSSHPST